MGTMTPEETKQARDALIRWFASQSIHPGDAVLIMIEAILAAISTLGPNPAAVREGKDIVADLIRKN